MLLQQNKALKLQIDQDREATVKAEQMKIGLEEEIVRRKNAEIMLEKTRNDLI